MKNNLFDTALSEVSKLENKYSKSLEINSDINRAIVSFQRSKAEKFYRWYKFKEAFSPFLVSYVISKLNIKNGELIDPFAGSGTSLFVAAKAGINSLGIELLPIGIEIIESRKIATGSKKNKIEELIKEWIEKKPWRNQGGKNKLPFLTITQGAYPHETEKALGNYLSLVDTLKDKEIKRLLKFAVLCVLEDVSYTRKDGQYLRWDSRSEKKKNSKYKPFYKNKIVNFDQAIVSKLQEILNDMSNNEPLLLKDLEKSADTNRFVNVTKGSCLEIMPKLDSNHFTILVTSPPYLNRYDYTRTYALELVLLGVGDNEIKKLRQDMISCTVENRDKLELDSHFSKSIYKKSLEAFDKQPTLKAILNYLDFMKDSGELNNSGIVRMVKNYFFEMSLIIGEAFRILKKNGYFVMVNDNVRYAGVDIPVDLILSEIASNVGFKIKKVWVLPNGKGNSSQQMGKHGRKSLRKCVYIWEKL